MENDLLLLIVISGLLWAFIWLERDVPHKNAEVLNWEDESFWWIRTFAIISILWTLTSWLDINFWTKYIFTIVTLIIITIYIAISHNYSVNKFKAVWVTSELAWIVVFFIWVSCSLLGIKFPVIFTVFLSILLAAKGMSEKFVLNFSRKELEHTIKFAVVSVVILPLLPDQKFSIATLLDSLWMHSAMDIKNNIWQMMFFNPYSVWFFVVAISAIWYIWYLLTKFLWKNTSVILSSVVWWLVSSTAVTAAMSEQSKKDSKNYHIYVLWALLANSIMLSRVIIIVLIINFSLLSTLFLPAILMFIWLAVVTFFFYRKAKKIPVPKNINLEWKVESPFSIKPAIKFWLFVLFLKFLAWIWVLYKDIWWESVFYYAFWVLSWLADVDAITQTMSVQAKDALVSSSIAVSTILIAAMSNNMVKWFIAVKFWDKLFWKYVMMWFLISMALWIGGIIYIS